MDADRFTRLDMTLIAEQQGNNEFADLRPDKDMLETFRQNRALLIERARKLERMGLATEIETGKWVVSREAEPTLRELRDGIGTPGGLPRALKQDGKGHMKRSRQDDFEVQVEEGEVEVFFKPTESYYTFAIRIDPVEIEEFGPLSPPSVRHANPAGDTDDYSSSEVAIMAASVAMKAIR